MRDISLKELLEAGCHFGHQVTRQNPKAREFIFQAREGIHIIDLAKTREGLLAGGKFVRDVADKGGIIIFVGTKRQAKGLVAEAAERVRLSASGGSVLAPSARPEGQASFFVVTERWIGGTLTNLEEVRKNYKKLKDLRARLANEEEKAKYTKKEVGFWEKERVKLEKLYGGVCDLEKLPDVVFIVDTHKEDLAVKEANRSGVPVVGIVDTNADPTVVDYPIAANDDAVGSLQLIISYITDAWIEGQKQRIRNQESGIKDEGVKKKVEAEVKRETKTNAKTLRPILRQLADQDKQAQGSPRRFTSGRALSASTPRGKPVATAKTKTKSITEKETKSGKHKPRTAKKAA